MLQLLKQSSADYIKNFDPSAHVSDVYLRIILSRNYTCELIKVSCLQRIPITLELLFVNGANNMLFLCKLWIFINCWNCQAFPQYEQLQQQYADKVHPEPYSSPFKNGSIRNVVADPDLPRGCDANSPEYDAWQ